MQKKKKLDCPDIPHFRVAICEPWKKHCWRSEDPALWINSHESQYCEIAVKKGNKAKCLPTTTNRDSCCKWKLCWHKRNSQFPQSHCFTVASLLRVSEVPFCNICELVSRLFLCLGYILRDTLEKNSVVYIKAFLNVETRSRLITRLNTEKWLFTVLTSKIIKIVCMPTGITIFVSDSNKK